MKKRLLIAVGCALAAMLCAWLYLRDVELRLTGGRMTSVLVAARALVPGTRINEADLALRDIPESYLHPESVLGTLVDEKKIIGRPIAVRVAQGQQLLWSDFESTKDRLAKSLSGAVQKGQRAVTLPVDVGGSFGSQVRPGDRVDVIGTFDNRKDHETTVTVLQNLLVLSVTGKRETVDGQESLAINAVTLSLEPAEAELLLFAAHHGSLNLTLRSDDDIDIVPDLPQKSFGDLFEDQKRVAMAVHRIKAGPQRLGPDPKGRP